MVIYTISEMQSGEFPQDDIIQAIEKIFSKVINRENDYFGVLMKELEASIREDIEAPNLLLQRRLQVAVRDKKRFGETPVVEINGITKEGCNLVVTIGSKNIIASLDHDNNMDKEVKNSVIPQLKQIILSIAPSAVFHDVSI